MRLTLDLILGVLLIPFAIAATIALVVYYDLINKDMPIYQDTGEDV